MKIFIDLDDVIFNTKKFNEDIQKVFERHGVPKNIFEEHHYDYPPNRNSAIKTYNMAEHIKKLQEFVKFDELDIINEIDKFTEQTQPYLFSDVIPFLENHKKDYLCLVSFGATNLQKKKVQGSGIGQYFKEITFADGLKSLIINNILASCPMDEGERVYFLDDRAEYIEDVKKNCRGIITIMVNRPEGRYCDESNENCDHAVKSLAEAGEIISKL